MLTVKRKRNIVRRSLKQKKRSHFVKSALEILKESGLSGFSARKVAENSGYNVASIYTYFSDLDHLENAASVYFTTNYAEQLNELSKKENTALENYLAMWELFALHSFEAPNYFYNVFFSKISHNPTINLFKDYYEAFPTERPQGGALADMLELSNTYQRENYALQKCVKAAQIPAEMLDYISKAHLMHFKCILVDIVKSDLYQPSPELYHQFLVNFCYSFLPYVEEQSRQYVSEMLEFHQKADKQVYTRLYL